MIKRLLSFVIAGALLASPVRASSVNDTITASISADTVYMVAAGNSQYASVWFANGFTCGTNYSSNGVRVATGHPRYADMLRVLLASQLSGDFTYISYELISGQCWLKVVSLAPPGG